MELRKGLKKGEYFEDAGRFFVIEEVLESGDYVSRQIEKPEEKPKKTKKKPKEAQESEQEEETLVNEEEALADEEEISEREEKNEGK